jgi:hypothetical protein
VVIGKEAISYFPLTLHGSPIDRRDCIAAGLVVTAAT